MKTVNTNKAHSSPPLGGLSSPSGLSSSHSACILSHVSSSPEYLLTVRKCIHALSSLPLIRAACNKSSHTMRIANLLTSRCCFPFLLLCASLFSLDTCRGQAPQHQSATAIWMSSRGCLQSQPWLAKPRNLQHAPL